MELSGEYGLPPSNPKEQKRVRGLFKSTQKKLNTAKENRGKIKEAISALMDQLDYLNIELPCQGVEYKGVVVGRDPEIESDAKPAQFENWKTAMGA